MSDKSGGIVPTNYTIPAKVEWVTPSCLNPRQRILVLALRNLFKQVAGAIIVFADALESYANS